MRLLRAPCIDGGRIAGRGGGYVGDRVLAAVAFPPELWAAGGDMVGIPNFVTFLENTSEYQPMLNTVEAGTTINLSYLMDLSNGDVHFVMAILEAFLSEVPASLQDLELLVKQNNWDQVSKLAHKLKPNFAMLGLKSLQEQALYIEVGIQHVAFDTVKMASAVDALVANTRLMLPLLALQKNTL